MKVSTPTLLPFTQGDWDCFNGCESETPYLAQLGDAYLLVDGCAVEYGGDPFDVEYGGDPITAEFPTAACAMLVAKAIVDRAENSFKFQHAAERFLGR